MAQFDNDGIRRIVNTVRRVEADPRVVGGGSGVTVSSGSAQKWYRAYNASGETIPAYSCVDVQTGSILDEIYHANAAKPSTTFSRSHALTGGGSPASTERLGICFEEGACKYDTGTPAVGETWGPKPSQWTLSKNYPGFRCVGILDSTNKIALWEREEINRLLVKCPSSGLAAYNGSTSFDVYVGPESSPVDSTIDLSCLVTGADIFRSKYAEAVFRNGAWIVEQRSMVVAGTLAGSLSQGSSATVNVGSDTVTGYDKVMKTGQTAIASGKKCYIAWSDYDKQWDVITVECA